MDSIISSFLVLILSYLLGSIPFGLLITRLSGEGDIRTIGSGNIGATNVLRTGKKGLALITFLLDALKGSGAVVLALWLYPDLYQIAGIVAVLGHIFPVWLNFKGGKGVATALGVLLILDSSLALIVIVTWVTMAVVWRYSSLAALIAIGLSPIYTYVLNGNEFVLTTLTLALILILTHKQNIARLLTGSESKIGQPSTTEDSEKLNDPQ